MTFACRANLAIGEAAYPRLHEIALQIEVNSFA